MEDIKQGFRKYFKQGNQAIILSLIACIIIGNEVSYKNHTLCVWEEKSLSDEKSLRI